MVSENEPMRILMAEDDPDDRLLMRLAADESGIPSELQIVEDGDQLLSYLTRQDAYADKSEFPDPDIILLDLNMPRLDGREALAQIKADRDLRQLPVVIFTTSSQVPDFVRSYEMGVSSFMMKPENAQGWVNIFRSLEMIVKRSRPAEGAAG